MSFFETLNFSSSNEDGASEAACVQAGDRVLALTGAGGRALDLLTADPAQVIALDLNPSQNALLALKIAALQTLGDAELRAYLGIDPSHDRLVLHRRVSSALDAPMAQYWAARSRQIAAGLWRSGRWERLLAILAGLARLQRPRRLKALFQAPTLQAQSRLWREDWDDGVWRLALRQLGRRGLWTHLAGEPGGAFLPAPNEVRRILGERFSRAADAFLFAQSDFAWLMLHGRHDFSKASPLWLRSGTIDQVRARVDRIVIRRGALDALDGREPFDVFSVSDFSSYCGQADYDRAWAGISAAAAAGARVVERVFLNRLTLSSPAWTLDEPESRRLTARDRAIIYDLRLWRRSQPPLSRASSGPPSRPAPGA